MHWPSFIAGVALMLVANLAATRLFLWLFWRCVDSHTNPPPSIPPMPIETTDQEEGERPCTESP